MAPTEAPLSLQAARSSGLGEMVTEVLPLEGAVQGGQRDPSEGRESPRPQGRLGISGQWHEVPSWDKRQKGYLEMVGGGDCSSPGMRGREEVVLVRGRHPKGSGQLVCKSPKDAAFALGPRVPWSQASVLAVW